VYHRDDGPGDQYLTVLADSAAEIPDVVVAELGVGWRVGAVYPQP
jgi:hypothetical protein